MKKVLLVLLVVLGLPAMPFFASSPDVVFKRPQSVAEKAAARGLGQAVDKTVYHELGEFSVTHLVVENDIVFIDATINLVNASEESYLDVFSQFYIREVDPPEREASIWNVPWSFTAGVTFVCGDIIHISAEYHFSGQPPENIEFVIRALTVLNNNIRKDFEFYVYIPITLDEERFLGDTHRKITNATTATQITSPSQSAGLVLNIGRVLL